MDVLFFLVGLALLVTGGDILVRSASRLALLLGMSPLLVGLTVVAMGTSAPELAASLSAALAGTPAIALGNVVGSNTANLGLILGLAALLSPLTTTSRFLRREALIMLASSVLLLALLRDGALLRAEGVLLLVLFALFTAYLLWDSRRRGAGGEPPDAAPAEPGVASRQAPLGLTLLLLLAGLALLVVGAQSTVSGATGIARALGVPDAVIGLTMVAVGTSLPELASTVAAAARRQGDMVLGNLIGSNIFNILFILGTTATVQPLRVAPDALRVDLWVMLGVSALTLPLLRTGLRLGRREGSLLLVLYAAYTAYLYLAPA